MAGAPRKIAVMQLVYSLQMGGSEKVAFDISAHLDPEVFDPSMCALDLGGSLVAELDKAHIPYHVLHRQGLEAGVFHRLYRLITERAVDVVHTHHFTQLFHAALPARLAGARIVHTEHEFFSYTQTPLPRRMIRPLAHLCDALTVVGPEVRDYFVRTVGMPRDRLTIVPNGVDVGLFDYDRDVARRELGLNPDAIVLGTIGRLEPEKDQRTLLDVFRTMAAAHPQARLMIAGDGSLAADLRSHAERIGVADRTLFLGYRRDVARLLAAIDIFALTSIREGLPISLIEAMAARCPVIASDIGSVRDLVKDGENGVVVAARNAAGFSDAVERLIGAPDLRRTLADAGRRTVEQSFSLAAVIRSYEDLYRSAVMKTYVRN